MPQKLAAILDRMDKGVAQTLRNCSLLSLWAQIVDERIKNNTEAVKIRNKTLYVSTSSPAWAQELGFLKKTIIEKFNRAAGGEQIVDVRFKAGGI